MPNTLQNPRSTYFGPSGMLPGVKWLLIVNCSVFVLYFFAESAGYGGPFLYFGLWPQMLLTKGWIWQLVTYLFLHDPHGFTHILINMLILWMIGADLERDWGTERFLKYYFLCGIGAGVCVVLANLFTGHLDTFTIGASGAVYGLLLAFGVLYPDRIVLFFFVFPIKAKYLVMIYGAIEFMSSFGSSGGGVSHVAHLGGMVLGYIYLKKGRIGVGAIGSATRQYESWRMRRMKRKFEVYRRHHDPKDHDRDRWIH
jgi:membrane associated rhomboid family serine protease